MRTSIGDISVGFFWQFNTGTIHSVETDRSVWRGGFGIEQDVFDGFTMLSLHKPNLERYVSPDKVRGKVILQFPRLTMALIAWRTGYKNMKTDVIYPKTKKIEIGSHMQQQTEVFGLLGDPQEDGTYKPLFPAIIKFHGHQARLALESVDHFCNSIYSLSNGYYRFNNLWVDFYLNNKTVTVGRTFKNQSKATKKYNNVSTEIYPVEIDPFLSSMDGKLTEGLKAKLIPRKNVDPAVLEQMVRYYKAAQPWKNAWDEITTTMRI